MLVVLFHTPIYTTAIHQQQIIRPNYISIYTYSIVNLFQRASLHHHFPPLFPHPTFFSPKKCFIQSIITLYFEDLLQLWDIFGILHILCSLLRDSIICLDYSQSDLGIVYSVINSQDYSVFSTTP